MHGEFIRIGTIKVRASSIESIRLTRKEDSGQPADAVRIDTPSDAFTVASGEPGYPEALTLYHEIDRPKPAGKCLPFKNGPGIVYTAG